MPDNPILISLSPNENNTPERVKDIVAAIDSFKGQFLRISDDAKQPTDIQCKWNGHFCHVEVKDTNGSNDLWGSKGGHIGNQLVEILDGGQPGFVVVCGDLDDVLDEVPTMTTRKTVKGTKTQWAGRYEQESNKSSLRALSADFAGCNVPIHYLSKNRVLSFKWALSYAKNILQGPNPLQWCPRFKGSARKQRALLGNGIGPKNAEALLKHFGSIRAVALAGYDDLCKCPGIGRERAISILELMQ